MWPDSLGVFTISLSTFTGVIWGERGVRGSGGPSACMCEKSHTAAWLVLIWCHLFVTWGAFLPAVQEISHCGKVTTFLVALISPCCQYALLCSIVCLPALVGCVLLAGLLFRVQVAFCCWHCVGNEALLRACVVAGSCCLCIRASLVAKLHIAVYCLLSFPP